MALHPPLLEACAESCGSSKSSSVSVNGPNPMGLWLLAGFSVKGTFNLSKNAYPCETFPPSLPPCLACSTPRPVPIIHSTAFLQQEQAAQLSLSSTDFEV